MSDDDASYMLASWAKQFTGVLLEICLKMRKKLPKDVLRKAGEIATRLRMVCPYIESLPRYWIETDVDQLCREILKHLVTISMWPEKVHFLPGFIVTDCNRRLANLLAKKGRSAMKHSVYEYFSTPRNETEVDGFNQDCHTLYGKLAPASAEEATGPPPSLGNVAQHDHSKHNQALFEIVEKHCQCSLDLHRIPSGNSAWHPARLCLEGDDSGASFAILVSSMDMSYWQEFRLSVPAHESNTTVDSKIFTHDKFCAFLEQQLFARMLFEFKPGTGLYQLPQSEAQGFITAGGRGEHLASILRHYRLTPRDKIILSYSIARAYWQFYDSELMRRKWSSETIWFMPTANGTHGGHDDRLPLQAFVTFPFDVPNDPPEDFIHDLRFPLNHRCPRIFALGIILLEIGLARPFPTRVFKNLTSQVNFDHTTAMNLLETLRNSKWDGFSHMRYFIDAVEYCIDGGNFLQDTNDPDSAQRDYKRSKAPKKQNDFSARRKNLHNRVVRPLAWLALKGFNTNSSGITYINRTADPKPLCRAPSSVTELSPQNGLFHSGRSAATRNWLGNLKDISAYVDQQRSAHGITPPVRVAILDTGINTAMPFYLNEDYGDDRLGQIECFRDFVNRNDSASNVDEFGHGSLMARVVAEATPFESTPFSKIMIARVAPSSTALPKCQDNIAEAIRWAGREGADIISISFGFPREHKGITQAIQEVSARDGGVVFLASAGNSAYEDEAFPARHPAVISIYATNRYGTFVESNSRRPGNGNNIFGTFSDDITSNINSEFDEAYRGVCQPGSSVSTAVAAGMAAIMLAYVAVLPKLIPSPPSNETLRVLRRVHDSQGMTAVFRAMA
ncbi:hypothetical protein BKA56DRAFT_575051 [Ilyonectria sp. MPI-CAGE-AT-0026]|nr:hypothetical protein BKA56DRAFT_575051 [Ilyonectria sp. MPI-CAGE-AT-0026]